MPPDRRLTPATPRAAHVSLRGVVAAEAFVEGMPLRVAVPVADLLAINTAMAQWLRRQPLAGDSDKLCS